VYAGVAIFHYLSLVKVIYEPNTEVLHRLRSKGLDKFYTKHADKWKKCADNAATYVKTFIGIGDKARPADVAEVLQNALKLMGILRLLRRKKN
jgi:hypothetical protein